MRFYLEHDLSAAGTWYRCACLFPESSVVKKIPPLKPESEPSDDAGSAGALGDSALGSTAKKRKKSVSRNQARRYARERALQALYQWEFSGSDASAVRKEFIQQQDMSRVDVDYFIELFNGVSKDPDAVDAGLQTALDRPIDELDPIERAILRLCVYELQHRLDIPLRVVINEGIEITKRFGADKGHRYVNGVLDKLAENLRPLESNG